LNLERSTHTLIPRREREEEPVVKELNIGAECDGDPAEEAPTTGERTGDKPGELAAASGDACECDESEPAIEE
jgi:hypothetical protein